MLDIKFVYPQLESPILVLHKLQTTWSIALEEVNSFAANAEIPNISSALKLSYCIDVFPPIASMPIDISHVHKFTYYLFQILFNIILSYACRTLTLRTLN